jgi:hypothetical protein
MSRMILADTKIAPKALEVIRRFYPEVVKEVSAAVANDPIVVVGMAHNPFVSASAKPWFKRGLASPISSMAITSQSGNTVSRSNSGVAGRPFHRCLCKVAS